MNKNELNKLKVELGAELLEHSDYEVFELPTFFKLYKDVLNQIELKGIYNKKGFDLNKDFDFKSDYVVLNTKLESRDSIFCSMKKEFLDDYYIDIIIDEYFIDYLKDNNLI